MEASNPKEISSTSIEDTYVAQLLYKESHNVGKMKGKDMYAFAKRIGWRSQGATRVESAKDFIEHMF